jgi:hypothetical protein
MEANTLTTDLIGSARYLMLRALDSIGIRDSRSFYLLGGMALEHLAKARLAREHPTLIVDRGDFDSMLVLSTNARLNPAEAASIRTIGLPDALKSCAHRTLVPSLAALLEDLRRLAARRNSAAHVGIVDDSSIEQDVIALLRATDVLLEAFTIERTQFYGDFIAFVDARVASGASAAKLQALAAITAAQRRYEKSGLPEDLHSYLMYDDDELASGGVLVTCPACANSALIEGPSSEGNLIDCLNLRCILCGLELSREELWALGIPRRCHWEEISEGSWEGDNFRKGAHSGLLD